MTSSQPLSGGSRRFMARRPQAGMSFSPRVLVSSFGNAMAYGPLFNVETLLLQVRAKQIQLSLDRKQQLHMEGMRISDKCLTGTTPVTIYLRNNINIQEKHLLIALQLRNINYNKCLGCMYIICRQPPSSHLVSILLLQCRFRSSFSSHWSPYFLSIKLNSLSILPN